MSWYFGAVTRICFVPHGMKFVKWKPRFVLCHMVWQLWCKKTQTLEEIITRIFCATWYDICNAKNLNSKSSLVVWTNEKPRKQHIFLSYLFWSPNYYIYVYTCINKEFSLYICNRVIGVSWQESTGGKWVHLFLSYE